MNASSMASELAPIVLYLRYLIQPGNLLIIEEPESHLHPAAQIEFIRQIALLVQQGVRVLVTTHSEWVLEALSNIVKRSGIPESTGGESANESVALDRSQVGVWAFQPQKRPKGSMVREVELDGSGLYSSDFDDVAMKLHNDWSSIVNRIQESE